MKTSTNKIFKDLFTRFSEINHLENQIKQAVKLIVTAKKNQNKILVCGNGGSCTDAEHISGELNKSFILKREIPEALYKKIKEVFPNDADMFLQNLQQGVPTISLPSLVATNTAYNNDNLPQLTYAQLVYSLSSQGDILICLSTSGNSLNVVNAAKIAKVLGVKVISLTGRTGGKLKEFSDILINVSEEMCYRVQELHVPIYHTICMAVESELFGE